MQEAGWELETTEAKPDWARALAGAMASWASENVQSMLDSEYEAAIGALSEVWSHVLFEVEKEEAKLQPNGAQETPNAIKSGPSETKIGDKPKAGKVAPRHVQDRQRKRVKDGFTNMGTPEESRKKRTSPKEEKCSKRESCRSILVTCAASNPGGYGVWSRAAKWKETTVVWG